MNFLHIDWKRVPLRFFYFKIKRCQWKIILISINNIRVDLVYFINKLLIIYFITITLCIVGICTYTLLFENFGLSKSVHMYHVHHVQSNCFLDEISIA